MSLRRGLVLAFLVLPLNGSASQWGHVAGTCLHLAVSTRCRTIAFIVLGVSSGRGSTIDEITHSGLFSVCTVHMLLFDVAPISCW